MFEHRFLRKGSFQNSFVVNKNMCPFRDSVMISAHEQPDKRGFPTKGK
jgi:hypothetical protein